MTAAELIGYIMVPLFGVFGCTMPLLTRPTVQFGVRVPPGRTAAPVIRRERNRYQWRSAVIAVCATAAVIAAVGDHGPWWPGRLILVAEVAADMGCFGWAHRRIAQVKWAEDWFAGQRQTVVADTGWRTEPPAFPARWLLPAAAVIATTVIIGVVRYPHLPGRSPASAFALVFGQLYVTGTGTGLLVLVYRSRADLDTADPAASLRSYRRALAASARGVLILLACVDLSLLLDALRRWRVLPMLHDGSILVVPFAAGLIFLFVTLRRAARDRVRAASPAGAADRDDDRFWKAGLFYVNRDDPAVVVSARFAFGWTPNLGNPAALLIIAGIIAIIAGLVIIRIVTGA